MRVDKTLKDSLEASLLKIHSDYSRLPTNVCGQVEVYLKCRPTLAGVSRDSVADALCMSSRTVCRRLRAQGVCFRELLTRERVQRCQNYMADGVCNGAEISRLLGFEDPSYFYRAFRMWTKIPFATAKTRMTGAPKKAAVTGGWE